MSAADQPYAELSDEQQAVSDDYTDESWELGDVVRNADDPADVRLWAYGPGSDDDTWPWIDVPGGEWIERRSLPERLTLVVRDGYPVADGVFRPDRDLVPPTEQDADGPPVPPASPNEQARTADGFGEGPPPSSVPAPPGFAGREREWPL